MSEVKVPFVAGGAYGVILLEHAELSQEEALAVLRSQMDFDNLALDVERRQT